MKTTSIQVSSDYGVELFVAHDFPAGQGKQVTLRAPGNPVSRFVNRLRGATWEPEDERSAYTGKTEGWPRSRIWRRYVQGGRFAITMDHRQPRASVNGIITGYGPMRSKVRAYAEFEQATTTPKRYGPREPISDSLDAQGNYNPIVDAPGGRWIGPYQGLDTAFSWWRHHVRGETDRATAAYSDPSLLEMLEPSKSWPVTPTCRFDVQARGNAAMSMLPSGKKSSAPWPTDPMDPWLSHCGNAGYNGAHLIRQFRAAMAMAWIFDDPTFREIASQDIGAIARDVTYTLSPYKAKPGYDGDTTVPPYNYPGAYMNWTPFAYRKPGPVGPDGGRTMGWYAYVLACASELGHRAEVIPTGLAFLTWTKDSLLPSGFIQSVRYDQTGGPQPKDCGVKAHEVSAAEIEAPIFAGAITALCLQVMGVIPNWCRDMLDKLCSIYLRHWPVGQPPAWGKYWVHGETDGRRYTADQVFMSPSGPRSTTNVWWLFEAGLRYGSPETRKAIHARRAEFENLWSTRQDIRPWAAGLLGALS